MADINKAYAILKSPEKREKYDKTGDTDQRKVSFQDRFSQFVQQVFLEVLNQTKDVDTTDMIDLFNKYVVSIIGQNEERIKDMESRKRKLDKVLKRITAKAENTIAEVLEIEIGTINKELVTANEGLDFLKEAQEHLKTYGYTVELPEKRQFRTSINFSTQQGFNGV